MPVNGSGSIVSGETITWKTDNPAVATIESNGVLTGTGAGSATITATASDKSGTIAISVSVVPVSTVELSSPTNPLPAGVPVTLTVVAKDSANRNLTGRQFTFSTSNPNVATVSSAGTITGKIPGGVVVTVQSEGKSAVGLFSVVLGPPASIVVSPGETYIGATNQLSATLRDPAGNTIPASSFQWSTTDASRVSVSQSGQITGVSGGLASISAKSGSVTGAIQSRTVIAKQVDGGTFHGCFLDDSALAYCWGRNSSNEVGNGIGATGIVSRPIRVAGGLQFSAISTGSSHACALTSDGTAYCWGSNIRGALGDGTLSDRATPAAVIAGLKFTSIAAGHDHTCAVTASGVAYCWGGVNYGSRPTEVTGGPPFVAISTGYSVACGLDASGKAYCWGNNDRIQLGTGDRIGSLTPRAVASSAQFTSISTFQYMSCGVTTQNEVICWGIGDVFGFPVPIPAKKSGAVQFKSIVTGIDHYCGFDLSNVAWCWGTGNEGQLGNSSVFGTAGEPVKVNLSLAGISGFAALGAGGAHTCGIAVDGVPYCWGRGEALGNPAGNNLLEPVILRAP